MKDLGNGLWIQTFFALQLRQIIFPREDRNIRLREIMVTDRDCLLKYFISRINAAARRDMCYFSVPHNSGVDDLLSCSYKI